MISIYIKNEWHPLINDINTYIEYEHGGEETLCFTLSNDHDLYKNILEETSVKADDNLFLIKKINKLTTSTDFECFLDMDDWKSNTPYKNTKELDIFITKTLHQILTSIAPSGWRVLNAGVRAVKRTIELIGATNYDVLKKCMEIFDVVYRYDTANKTIYVIDHNEVEDKGIYIHPELNLKTYGMKSDTSQLINRIYCEGKDGMTFADINGGKDYVENVSYKGKIISGYWKDERYTDKHSFLNDAKKKVNSMSTPSRSYTVNVIDLAEIDSKYDFLKLELYSPVHAFVGEIEIVEKVVRYKKYLKQEDSHKNVITISNDTVTLTNKIENALGTSLNDDIPLLEKANAKALEILNEFSTNGYRYETESETYFLDKLPKEEAKYVMRMNLGGIAFSQNGWQGPYTTAWTIDGQFNASFIKTGILEAIRIESSEISGTNIYGSSLFGVDIRGGSLDIDNNARVGKRLSLGSVTSTSLISGIEFDEGQTIDTINGHMNISVPDYALNGHSISLAVDNSYHTSADSLTMQRGWTLIACQSVNQGFDGLIQFHCRNLTSDVALRVASDRRTKENIQDIDLTSILDDFSLKSFDLINGSKNEVGVIAQDFERNKMYKYVLGMSHKILGKKKNGKPKLKKRLNVNYNAIYLATTQEVCKLRKKVIEQNEKIVDLENRINKLEEVLNDSNKN